VGRVHRQHAVEVSRGLCYLRKVFHASIFKLLPWNQVQNSTSDTVPLTCGKWPFERPQLGELSVEVELHIPPPLVALEIVQEEWVRVG
jgi:hypothetical protein